MSCKALFRALHHAAQQGVPKAPPSTRNIMQMQHMCTRSYTTIRRKHLKVETFWPKEVNQPEDARLLNSPSPRPVACGCQIPRLIALIGCESVAGLRDKTTAARKEVARVMARMASRQPTQNRPAAKHTLFLCDSHVFCNSNSTRANAACMLAAATCFHPCSLCGKVNKVATQPQSRALCAPPD